MLATTVVFSGVLLVWAIPIWVGLLNADMPLDKIFYAFADLVSRGDVEGINNVLGDAFLERYRFLSFLELLIADCSVLSVGSLAGCRGRVDGGRDGTAGILGPQLESEPGLCSAHRWLPNALLSIVMGLFGALIGALVEFAVAAVAFRRLTSHGRSV